MSKMFDVLNRSASGYGRTGSFEIADLMPVPAALGTASRSQISAQNSFWGPAGMAAFKAVCDDDSSTGNGMYNLMDKESFFGNMEVNGEDDDGAAFDMDAALDNFDLMDMTRRFMGLEAVCDEFLDFADSMIGMTVAERNRLMVHPSLDSGFAKLVDGDIVNFAITSGLFAALDEDMAVEGAAATGSAAPAKMGFFTKIFANVRNLAVSAFQWVGVTAKKTWTSLMTMFKKSGKLWEERGSGYAAVAAAGGQIKTTMRLENPNPGEITKATGNIKTAIESVVSITESAIDKLSAEGTDATAIADEAAAAIKTAEDKLTGDNGLIGSKKRVIKELPMPSPAVVEEVLSGDGPKASKAALDALGKEASAAFKSLQNKIASVKKMPLAASAKAAKTMKNAVSAVRSIVSAALSWLEGANSDLKMYCTMALRKSAKGAGAPAPVTAPEGEPATA